MNSPPEAPWACRRDTKPVRLPQVIGHRGYKAAFPENTMSAFRGAVDVGAHAIEADLHLSKDGVVVLSHDATLKRCFGRPLKIADCDWNYLSTLRTLREPRQPMPRLVDLLEYLAQPEQAHVWLLLDIKTDDDSTQLLTRLAATIASVPTSRPWNQRLILGPWDAHWMAACLRFLPGFSLALIAYSPEYATALLPVHNLNFNVFNYSFATPSGSRFFRQVKKRGRLTFSWSDNQVEWMARSLRNEVDAVITDDPKLFLELCNKWHLDETQKRALKPTMKQTALWVLINFMVLVTEIIFRLLKGSPSSRVKKVLGTLT
ncbi:PLC-like phosphodiesterase [Hypoxylon sp. FL1857]|nr:PLC-like phosphodiesterase [Hypoxylon sp. FL1857]